MNVGIQMKACKNAIYLFFFCKAAANRLQIYKTLFIYLFFVTLFIYFFLQAAANRLQIYKTLFIYLFIFVLVYKDAVKLKNLCLTYKDAVKLKNF